MCNGGECKGCPGLLQASSCERAGMRVRSLHSGVWGRPCVSKGERMDLHAAGLRGRMHSCVRKQW